VCGVCVVCVCGVCGVCVCFTVYFSAGQRLSDGELLTEIFYMFYLTDIDRFLLYLLVYLLNYLHT